MEYRFEIMPMQNSSQEKEKPPIIVNACELASLAQSGFIKIESTRVRYAMLADIAKINGGRSAFAGGDDPTEESSDS